MASDGMSHPTSAPGGTPFQAGSAATGTGASSPSSVRLPILVGITGKRELSPDQTISVRRRLTEVFHRLDIDFPNVPKVLLTGAAYGADAIAAEVLTRADQGGPARFRDWSVIALLPFDQDMYEMDFRPKAEADAQGAARAAELAAERLGRLQDLLSASERVIVRVLPALRTKAGTAARREVLDKDGANADVTLRREHYEQVGQCIAEAATILIAVMDGSEAAHQAREGGQGTAGRGADGGTARIVAYRRAGRPDLAGTSVAERSAVLRDDWGALVDPPAASVWLIEPDREARVGAYPVLVLTPIAELSADAVYAEPAYSTSRAAPRWWARGTGPWRRRRRARHNLRASLAIIDALNQLHREADQANQAPALNLSRDVRPTDAIIAARMVISQVQTHAKARADRAFVAIATLFVLAVLFLEMFSKFYPENPVALGLYLVALAGIFAVVGLSRYKRWQPLSEDYRAVNEMLRVQWAWWSAGLSNRIDHLHLQSLDPELARIRHAVQTILGWIWLRSGWTTAQPSSSDWAAVRGHGVGPRPTKTLRDDGAPARDWIGSQIQFYARRQQTYSYRVRRLGALLWSLFAASGWLAGVLCLWLVSHETRDPFLHLAMATKWLPSGHGAAASIIVTWTGLAAGVIGLWSWVASRPVLERMGRRRWLRTWTLLTAGGGLLAALLLAVAVQGGAMRLAGSTEAHATATYAEHLAVLLFVTLSALAGAIRYVSEKLNFEALSLEYGDILERFERAERLLAEGADPETGVPARMEVAQRVVRDLALLALRENEAWLKACRERPVSPIVG